MDRWDAIEAVSIVLVVIGTAAIYWPAALILAGVIGLLAVLLREFASVSRSTRARNDSAE